MPHPNTVIRRALPLLAVAALSLDSPAGGQQPCAEAATLGECWRPIRAKAVAEAAQPAPGAVATAAQAVAAVREEAAADLQAQPAGQDTGGATLQSTTKDFLPLAAIAGLLGKGGEADDQGDLVFDLNFLLPGGLGGKNSQLQAVAKTAPTLLAAVRAALPEASRSELAGQLEEKIAGGDDLTVSFTYNLQSLNRGRSFELYRNRHENLVRPHVRTFENQQQGFADLIDEVIDLCPAAEEIDGDQIAFAKIAAECGAETELQARALAERAFTSFLEPLSALRANLVARGLDRFAELVANQPQLHVQLQRREREPLVGADGTSGKLTFEWSRTNLKRSMSADCHRRLESATLTSADRELVAACAAQYDSYVDAHTTDITEGERFTASLEYEHLDSSRVPLSTLLPAAGVADFRSPDSRTRIARLGWSRNFAGPQGQPTRLDLVASYEDVTGDPTRHDRLVATATFNLKAGNVDVPLGIVYANHGKYLGEVDEQLSAHLGLKFDLTGFGPKP